MSYSFESKVRYSELDETGHLSLYGVLNYFQDCCIFHSESIGQGMEILKNRNRVWVLSAWQIVLNRYPALGEDLRISTWPYEFKGFLGSRNFTLDTKDGERLAYANTLWSYLDSRTGIPQRLTEEDTRGYEENPKLDMNYAPRRIRVPADGRTMEPISVIAEYLDTNHHVNNAQYISLAGRYLPKDFVIRQMRAEYKSQTRLGDILVPVVYTGEDTCVIQLNQPNGQVSACVEFCTRC